MAAASEVCLVVVSQDTSRKMVFFVQVCLFWDLSGGEASFRSLDDNGDGADCVSSFDDTMQMLSHAGVDGALERSCAFLFLLTEERLL